MAGRRQALRPEFVQNIEFQQFLGEMFVHSAYRQTPENAVYYNQVKREENKNMEFTFTKEQITFIMQCVINACELFNDEYDAIEEELEKYEKKGLTNSQQQCIINLSNEREVIEYDKCQLCSRNHW